MTNWIPTYSGLRLDLEAPDPSQISLIDIAQALSQQCRYNGHTLRHYSTAEHSVRLSLAVPSKVAAAMLLHDASETYMGDVVWPLKRLNFMTSYKRREDKLLAIIFEKYKIGCLEESKIMKLYDRAIVALEAENLYMHPGNLPRYPNHKELESYREDMKKVFGEEARLRQWGWEAPYARIMFLERAAMLGIEDSIAASV